MTVHAEYVDTPSALEALVARSAGRAWIALDTEFMRERTYFPKLCLVQLATEDWVACIDALALPDLGALAPLLTGGRVVKVLHSARQDVEALLAAAGILPAPLFDTQIAAALLGYSEQVSYAELVQSLLGDALEKGHTRTDWTRRPLSAGQLEYAAADVYHLARIYPLLRQRLEAAGRLAWHAEECALLAERGLYETEPEQSWRRIRGGGRLRGRHKAALRGLAAWREREAVRRDQPRGFIVRDAALLGLAERLPADRSALARVPEIGTGTVKRYGRQVLEIVAAAGEEGAPTAGADTARRLEPAEQALLGELLELVRQRAADLDISASMLATRSQVEALVREPAAASRLLGGWRRSLVGDDLMAILRGRQRLARRGERLHLEPVSP